MSQNKKNLSASTERSPFPLGERGPLTSERYRRAIEEAADRAVGDLPVHIEFDLPTHIDCPFDVESLETLVHGMVKSSLSRTDGISELLITVCSLNDSFEVEVADDGETLDHSPIRSWIAASLGLELMWQTCPQGGMAQTAVAVRQHAQRVAA